MASLKDNLTHLITEDEIKEATFRIAKEIEIDYHGKEIVLVCPLKGSFMFISDLARNIQSVPVVLDFVYLKSMKSGEAVEIRKDIETNITEKHVIIVEEIIDAGRTLTFYGSAFWSVVQPRCALPPFLINLPVEKSLSNLTTVVSLLMTAMWLDTAWTLRKRAAIIAKFILSKCKGKAPQPEELWA